MTTAQVLQKNGQLVGTKHVDQLISRYKKERWVANTQFLGKPDSLSTWFGIEEITQFLRLASEHGADGIKVYYGVYPEDFEGDIELRGRQTVVLVATKEKKTENGLFHKNLYVPHKGGAEILAFNYGTACPPFCGGNDPLGTEGIPFGLEMERVGLTILEDEKGIKVI